MKKSLEQQIRLVMEGQANAGVLEYGSDIARDTYAKDTPGQTPGVEHDPIQHQHKPNLALDGVPVPGGQLKKPNFEKDAGMGKVAEAKDMKVKNCGCGKDPCETYGSKEEQMKTESMTPNSHGYNVQQHAGELAKKDGKDIKKLPYGHAQGYRDKASAALKKEEAELDEAGRWENTSQGRAYRRLSPEEKARRAKANMLMKKSGAPKSRVKVGKQGIGKLKTVYKGSKLQRNDVMSDLIADLEMAYLGEAMSDSERKQAAAKIFRMHQAKQAAKQASTALGKKSDPAAKAARRDSASYKTSDDSHLDSKPKAPEKKRGRGERDLPHIVSQLRGVVDTKDGKPSSVKFKDGTTKSVSPNHAKKWLKKHDSAKPSDKLSMYKSHDSHKSFQSHVGEAVDKDDTEVLKKLSKDLKGSMKAHGKQKKALDKAINEGSKPNNPKLWAAKKAAAKAKFDVYPSAYANGWAAKAYKKAGGTWRSESVEHDLNELSGKTLSNYIQKSANPVKKNSAVNLASRGGYKLGSSEPHDLDAGEKEDKKAYNRGQGMQRAAIKLQKKMYGKKTNEAIEEAMKNVYGEAWFDTASYPTHKDHRKKTADRKTADSLNKPNTLKKRQAMHPAHRKAYDAKVRQNNYDTHGVGSKKETTPLDKKLHHPDVKAP